jgi:hypothetical protein
LGEGVKIEAIYLIVVFFPLPRPLPPGEGRIFVGERKLRKSYNRNRPGLSAIQRDIGGILKWI